MENQKLQEIGQPSQQLVDHAKKESYEFLNPQVWQAMTVVAQTFLQSGALPSSMNTAPKIMVALQAGKEMGLQPIEAVSSFYFVNGKVSMYGEMAIAQVVKAGHKIEWGDCNDKTATIKITRGDNKTSNTVTFTMEMATTRGLNKRGGPWVTAPDNMLRFKAFHACAKFIVPDALHGVSIKEVAEVEVIEVEQKTKKKEEKKEVKVEVVNVRSPLSEAIKSDEEDKEEPEKEEVKTKKKKGKKMADLTDEEKKAKYHEIIEKRNNNERLTRTEEVFLKAYEVKIEK